MSRLFDIQLDGRREARDLLPPPPPSLAFSHVGNRKVQYFEVTDRKSPKFIQTGHMYVIP
jgi:hypothetical protein